jgi:hypothetical protein
VNSVFEAGAAGHNVFGVMLKFQSFPELSSMRQQSSGFADKSGESERLVGFARKKSIELGCPSITSNSPFLNC